MAYNSKYVWDFVPEELRNRRCGHMLDDDFDYDEYDGYNIKEKKPVKERLRKTFFGLVITGLVVVVGATAVSKYMNQTNSYGRIKAAGELYEAPTYENGFRTISYESLHPELAPKSQEVQELTEQQKNLEAEKKAEKEKKKQKAMENLLKIGNRDAKKKAEERAEKYQKNVIQESTTVTTTIIPEGTSPGTGQASSVESSQVATDYYNGGYSPPIYVDAASSGAEYLGEWEITAYCACVICCEKSDGITASGAYVKANHTVAGPKEFPFGTQLIINGQLYVVEDRGGGIHGNRIDIYFNTHQDALNFGRQHLDVYRLN